MSVHHVSFHRLAVQEYRGARDWYEEQRIGLGYEFVQAIDRAVRRIAENPTRWPETGRGFRWVKVRRFPYVLHFHVLDAANVLVLAVAHGRRRQGYWMWRLRRP